MKILLAVLLALAARVAPAQAVPPAKANTIIVTLPDSGQVAWRRIAQALIDRGYSIKNSDKDLLLLTTEGKQTGRAGAITVSVSLKGNQATVRATQFLGSFGMMQVDYRGMKGSPNLLGWQELEAAAKAFGGTLAYTRR